MFKTGTKTCYNIDDVKGHETHPSPIDEIGIKKRNNGKGIKGHREVARGAGSNSGDPANHDCIIG